MDLKEFMIKFGLFSCISALFIGLLHFIPVFTPYLLFSGCSILLYILLTILMFAVGKFVIKSKDKRPFTALLLQFNALRILVSVVFVFAYITQYKPVTQWFVIPFFAIYILFTIFEVYMLSNLE